MTSRVIAVPDLIDIDSSVRTTLRTMRPLFAKNLPSILARFYDRVRHYDPDSGLFRDGVMQEAIRQQLQHWELIAASEEALDGFGSRAQPLRDLARYVVTRRK